MRWSWFLIVAVLVAGCDRSSGSGNDGDASVAPDAGDSSVMVDAADAGPTPDAGDDGGVADAEVSPDGSVLPSSCDPAVLGHSHLGCAFWAVDLDNEHSPVGSAPSAAAGQFGVLVANPQSTDVAVEVFQNTAPFGDPVVETLVTSDTVVAGDQLRLDLPQREVDGSMGQNGIFVANSGSGTFVSSHGYRIASDAPVAVYQFNPVVDVFSNDAALLLPEHALGIAYTVVGWPTANPCGNVAMPMESIPDHTSVTVVGVTPGTQVTVDLTYGVLASGGSSGLVVPETPAGGQVVVTLGPFDVLNLESLQPVVGTISECLNLTDQDGDFSGTRVTATAPVVVFSSAERGRHDGGTGAQPSGGDSCCTDHLEEQLLPDHALGQQFAVARSPVRTAAMGSAEPDVFRVVATTNNTVVSTSLAPPWDQFTLQAGDATVFASTTGFSLEAQGGAVSLGQYLLSAGWVTSSDLGDPAWVVVPPVDQMRTHYLVAVPDTYADNYLVLTYPTGTALQLDGVAIGPSTPGCEQAPVGTVGTTTYEQLTCSVGPQAQEILADQPVAAAVFGYGSVSAHAYSAGLGLAPINP